MSWLLETLVASTALMLLVLAIREPVARAFGARAAYALWALPALRMILPPIPESVGPPPLAQLPVIVEIAALDIAPAGVDWSGAALTAWLLGAAALIMWQLFAYHRFVATALDSATALPEMDADGIEVCASPLVAGPFAAGLLTPTIVLPGDWRTRYSRDELRLALSHERVHHQRGDLGLNMIALAVLALHWWNPVAWLAWRAFRADQELACDAVVLDGADAEARHSYGAALVKSVCPATPAAACALNPRDQLKRRLTMLRPARDRRRLGRALAVTLTGAGLALTASGGIAAETTREVREKIATRVAPVVAAIAPTPSAPPAPPVARVAPASAPKPPRAPTPPLVVDVDEAIDEALAATAPPPPPVARPAPMPLPPLPPIAVAPPHPKCAGKAMVSNIIAGPSHQQLRLVICAGAPDPVKLRAIQIQAIARAREGLAEAHGIESAHLAQALAGLDAELARLRAENHLGH